MKYETDISILFSDLDGTLLDDKKNISMQTLRAMQEVRKRNIRIFISTARILRTAMAYAKEIQSDGIIFCCGAGILYNDGQVVFHPMQECVVTHLLNEVSHAFGDVRYSVTTPDTMYTSFYGENTIYVTENTLKNIKNPLRIIFYHPDLELEMFLKKRWGEKCNIQVLEGNNIIVTSKEATKENAVVAVLHHYGVSFQNVVYFGDDFSDCECIKCAKYGIATQNAPEFVKQQAFSVTKSNNEEGVAHWIWEHLIVE